MKYLYAQILLRINILRHKYKILDYFRLFIKFIELLDKKCFIRIRAISLSRVNVDERAKKNAENLISYFFLFFL